jgi:hypothetical protein
MARRKFRGFSYAGKNTAVRVIDGTIFPNADPYKGGKFFRSKKEARRYVYLKHLEAAGEIAMLADQVPFDLAVGGVWVARYVADFCYLRGGAYVVEDVKGFLTEEFLMKQRLMRAVLKIDVLTV